MKTNYITFIITAFCACVFFSCSTPYSATTNPRLISDWKVDSITVEGDVAGMQIPVPVFNDVTIGCLLTSKWSLYDGGGTYTIPPGDSTCASGARKISWEVVNLAKNAHYFQFYRFMAPKGILSDRFTPYLMEVALLTKNGMVLKYPIKYQDKTGSIVFKFSKSK